MKNIRQLTAQITTKVRQQADKVTDAIDAAKAAKEAKAAQEAREARTAETARKAANAMGLHAPPRKVEADRYDIWA